MEQQGTLVGISFSSKTLVGSDRFLDMIKKHVEHDFTWHHSEIYKLDVENPEVDMKSYVVTNFHLTVPSNTLSDTLTQLELIFAMVYDSDYADAYEDLFDDHHISVLLKDRTDPIEVNEALYHNFNKIQELTKTMNAVENSNIQMHKVIVELQKKFEQLDNRYVGLQAYLFNTINLEMMRDVLVDVAQTASPQSLDLYKTINYQ